MENSEKAQRMWEMVEQVHRCISADPQFKSIFAAQQFDLEYHITDWDLVFTVQIDHGQLALLRAESGAPAIVMEMNGSHFHKMCSGTIIMPMAILSRRIKMTLKDRQKAAGAFPLTAITQRIYKQVYEEYKTAGKWVLE